MPRIAFESEVAKEREWAVAVSLLNDAPEGTKIKRAVKKQPIAYHHPDDGSQVCLQHSFIKVNGKILCMAGEGEHLGKGSFGVVKLAEDANGNQYALKTSINKPEEEKVIPGANEAETLEDLGLSWGTNLSRGTTQYPRSKESKHVAALTYLGISLDDYLKSHESLTRKQRYDLAIKTAKCVYQLHHGYGSKKRIERAHLDIKPHNFCIDEHGKVSLIDYGSASELSGKNTLNSRTIPYSPLFDSKIRKNEYFDIFALKRVLFLPEEYWVLGANFGAQRLERWQAGEYILRDELDFLDTSNGRLAQHQHSAADVLAILILSCKS